MNFLFLTTMMILIFMLTSLSMTGSLKTTASIARGLENVIHAKYSFENCKAKTKYSSSKKSKKHTDKSREKEREGKSFTPRDISPCENSKLNLYPLIGGNFKSEEKKLLTKTLKNLIYEIYKNESFYIKEISKNSNFVDIFTDKLIAGLKKTKSLAKTPFLSKKDREMFLTLCKGSYKASVKSIPLLDYITLRKIKDGPFITFKSMPISLLNAFFDNEITKNILDEEEEIYFEGRARARLTEEELEDHLDELNYDVHRKVLSFKNLKFDKGQIHIKTSGGALITLGPPELIP